MLEIGDTSLNKDRWKVWLYKPHFEQGDLLLGSEHEGVGLDGSEQGRSSGCWRSQLEESEFPPPSKPLKR